MKKLITFVLMVTYMASAIGFTYSLHYCGGHYKYVCFTSDTEKGCCGKNEHKTNCCKDVVIKAKFKNNHNPSAKAILSHTNFECIAPTRFEFTVTKARDDKFARYIAKDLPPPLSSQVPLYLLNRVFRI
jgi:hypothetical protein